MIKTGKIYLWVVWIAMGWMPVQSYIEREFHLSEVSDQSTNIVTLRVKAVDEAAGKIIYEVEPNGNLKGETQFHIIQDYIFSSNGNQAQGRKILKLVKVGDPAVMFYQTDGYTLAAEKHVAGLWYQTHSELRSEPDKSWWSFQHEEVYLDRTFCGTNDELRAVLKPFLKGQTVEITRAFSKQDKSLCKVLVRNDGYLGPMKFLPVRPRVVEPDRQFGRQIILPGTAGSGRGCTWVDYDLDGRLDAYLCNTDGNHLFHQLSDGSWQETTKEVGLGGSSAAAVWADYLGNGRPSVLLSSSPPRLYSNLLTGRFRDDSDFYLPKLAKNNLGGIAWLDYNRDGLPDILLANAQYGIQILENTGGGRDRFVDVSEKVGLGVSAGASGNFVTTVSFSQGGPLGFLYNSLSGIFYGMNERKIFQKKEQTGLTFESSPRVGVAWGDFNNDGFLDLFVPQEGRSLLFQGDGQGHFTNVTEKTGDLAKNNTDRAVCACWGDFNNDGLLDLFVGNMSQPNRFYLNTGNGTFSDKTNDLGLGEKIWNTTSAVAGDFDHNGTLDLLTNNLGENAVILINDLRGAKKIGITFKLQGLGVIGATIQCVNASGKILGYRQVTGSNGFGSQDSLDPFMALPRGKITIKWVYSHGAEQTKSREIQETETVDLEPVRAARIRTLGKN